jgi:hypothetical protein
MIARQLAKPFVGEQVLLLEVGHVALVDDDIGLEVEDLSRSRSVMSSRWPDTRR